MFLTEMAVAVSVSVSFRFQGFQTCTHKHPQKPQMHTQVTNMDGKPHISAASSGNLSLSRFSVKTKAHKRSPMKATYQSQHPANTLLTAACRRNRRGTLESKNKALPFSVPSASAETPKATYWESGQAGSRGRSSELALDILDEWVHRVETLTLKHLICI